ncbi:MAG: hypothetical protein ABFR33_01495 [Verrucomicrobiota bacterium]
MKKILCIVAVAAMALAVQAEEAAKDDDVGSIGVGYQGMFLGNLLNGVAVRGTPAPIGWQVELTQGMLDTDGGPEVDLLVLKGKAYYALVERENSKLYAGASVGYWMVDLFGADIDGFSIAPLIGAEWNFAELPELGFNFEVSYEITELEADGGGDLGISGINVSTGIVYYF